MALFEKQYGVDFEEYAGHIEVICNECAERTAHEMLAASPPAEGDDDREAPGRHHRGR